MAQKHRIIYRDNFFQIKDKDLVDITGTTDPKIQEFLKYSNSQYYEKKHINNLPIRNFLEMNIINELGPLFANAYKTHDYTQIEKYITDNNVQEPKNINILNNKTGMRYLLMETIQNIVLAQKYILRKELVEYFKKMFVSKDIGVAKPSIEFFNYILENSKSIGKESIFVDDAKTNLATAKEFGITTVWFNRNVNDERNYVKYNPDFEIKSLKELNDIIKHLNKLMIC